MKTLFLILIIFANISCTRKKSKTTIHIDFGSSLQKNVSASAITDIETLILNISGSDMETIYVEADCDNDCTHITAEFDSGENRLIQLLAVGTTGTAERKLLYGDTLKSLQGGDQTVTISVTEKASFSKPTRWIGRYVPEPSHGLNGQFLTGNVDMMFYPGNNKPDLIVSQFEIYGGWFHSFLLDSVKFKYRFTGFDSNGTSYESKSIMDDLHGGSGLNSDHTNLTPAAADNDKLHFTPSTNLFREGEGSAYNDEIMHKSIIGFFGANPDGRSLCSKFKNPSLNFDFDGGGEPEGTYRGRLCKVAGTTCAPPNWAEWTDIAVRGTFNYCQSPSPGQWPIDHRLIENQVDFAGFYGPYSRDISANQDLILEVIPDPLGIGWHIDPNAYVSSIEVFTRVGMGSFDEKLVKTPEDTYDCSLLESHGFVSRSQVAKGTDAYSYLPEDIAAAAAGTGLQVAFCPRSPAGHFMLTAFVLDNTDDNGGHQPPTQISMERLYNNGNTYINQYACTPFRIELQDDGGNLSGSNSPVLVNLTTNEGSFFSDDQCSSGLPGSQIAIDRDGVVFFKHTMTAGTQLMSADDNASVLNGDSYNFTLATNGSTQVKMFPSYHRAQVLEQATTEVCQNYFFAAVDANEELVNTPGGATVFFTAQNIGTATRNFYSSRGNCETSSTPLNGGDTLNPGINETLHEYWYENLDTSPDTISTPTSGCSTLGCIASTIAIVNPSGYDHFHPDLPDGDGENYDTGDCVEIRLGAYDNHQPNAYPNNWPSSGVINLSVDGTGGLAGSWHSDASCLSGAVTSVGVSGGATDATVYFKPSSAGTPGQLIFTYDHNGDQNTVLINISSS